MGQRQAGASLERQIKRRSDAFAAVRVAPEAVGPVEAYSSCRKGRKVRKGRGRCGVHPAYSSPRRAGPRRN
jgi:hypothetical protein